MKILRNIRRAFSLVGYLSDEGFFAFKFGHEIVSAVFIVMLILFESSSVIYAVRHLKSGDYQNFLHASYQLIGLITAIVSFFTMMWHKGEIRDVIADFQEIFDKCKSSGYWSHILKAEFSFITHNTNHNSAQFCMNYTNEH